MMTMIEAYRLGVLFTAGFILGDLFAIPTKNESVPVWSVILPIVLWPAFWVMEALTWLANRDEDNDDDDLFSV